MLKWLKRNWVITLLLIIWAILIFWVTYKYLETQQVFFAALIGPIIAIGPTVLYYVYKEYVKQPRIEFGHVSLDVAPMYVSVNIKEKDIETPLVFAMPTVFMKIMVENKGRATAKDCKVQVWVKEKGNRRFYARWALIENPEEHSLLPGESLNIHVLKLSISMNFHFLKDKKIFDEKVNNKINKDGFPSDLLFNFQKDGHPEFTLEDVKPRIGIPKGKPVMQKEKPERGGWEASWSSKRGRYTLKLQAIADDYKTEVIEKRDYSWMLPDDFLKAATDEERDIWQGQWGDLGYGLKRKVIDACKDWLKKNKPS